MLCETLVTLHMHTHMHTRTHAHRQARTQSGMEVVRVAKPKPWEWVISDSQCMAEVKTERHFKANIKQRKRERRKCRSGW